MGFDPRSSSAGRPPSRGVVTSNVDTLLAENDALRREVRRLRLQLQELQMERSQRGRTVTGGEQRQSKAAQVERWGIAMARHPRWQELRLGPPGGLRGLVEQRGAPALGAELAEALRGPHSRVRWAVRAAFALHGQRAPEWLSEAPLRLVDDLLRLTAIPRRGTRTANHSQGRSGSSAEGAGAAGGARGAGASSAGPSRSSTDSRTAALLLLGLEPGASSAAIKRAYRRLAKAHHPDLGGDAEAFHRLDAAYRLLIG
jgi:hypothetical protein